MSLCKHGLRCRFIGFTCNFEHPASMCPQGFRCSNKDSGCRLFHPSDLCPFGVECKSPKCPLRHPPSESFVISLDESFEDSEDYKAPEIEKSPDLASLLASFCASEGIDFSPATASFENGALELTNCPQDVVDGVLQILHGVYD